MFKRVLNRSQDYLFALPWIEKKWITQLKGNISCLLYHRIEEYGVCDFLDKGGSPVTTPNDFDREISYLKTLPTRFYTFEELNQGVYPDSNTIGLVICFDDGFKCNYHQGLDVLNKHEIPAVFFQCSSFIDSKQFIWEHNLYWIYSNNDSRQAFLDKIAKHMTSTEPKSLSINFLRESINPILISQIAQNIIKEHGLSGQIAEISHQIYPISKDILKAHHSNHEIASHGHHHYMRQTISKQSFEDELIVSKNILTKITNKAPVSFSYPFNNYQSSDNALASQYFTNIATVEPGRVQSPLTSEMNIIPRLTWPGKSNNIYRMKRWLLSGHF